MIKTTGIEREIKRIYELPELIDFEMIKVVNRTAGNVFTEARRNTPTRSGTLKRGFRATPAEKIGDEYFSEITNNVEYVEHVEYGHREFVYGRATGRVRPGRYMLTNAEKAAAKLLPKRVERAMKIVEKIWEAIR